MRKTALILVVCMVLSIIPVNMYAASATFVDSCTMLDGDGKTCYGIILGNDTAISSEFEDQNGFRAESTAAGSYVKYYPGGDLKSFTVEASYYKRNGVYGDDLMFEVSSDDSTYIPVEVTRTGNTVDQAAAGSWNKVVWTADSLPEGSKYLRILFGSTSSAGKSWVVHMSKVEIEYESDGELPPVLNYYSFESDFETVSELNSGWSKFLGSQNGMENIVTVSTDASYSGNASLVLENLGSDTRSVTCYRNFTIRKFDDVINSSVMVYLAEDVEFNGGWVRYTIKPQVDTTKSIMIDISVYENKVVANIDGIVTTTDYPEGTKGQWLLLETGDFTYPQGTSLVEVSLESLNSFQGKVYFDVYQYKSSEYVYELTWPEEAEISVDNVYANSVVLSWPAVTGGSNVTYTIYEGNTAVAQTTDTTYEVEFLTPQTSYSFKVDAKDEDGKRAVLLSPVTVTTTAPRGEEKYFEPFEYADAASLEANWTLDTDDGKNAAEISGDFMYEGEKSLKLVNAGETSGSVTAEKTFDIGEGLFAEYNEALNLYGYVYIPDDVDFKSDGYVELRVDSTSSTLAKAEIYDNRVQYYINGVLTKTVDYSDTKGEWIPLETSWFTIDEGVNLIKVVLAGMNKLQGNVYFDAISIESKGVQSYEKWNEVPAPNFNSITPDMFDDKYYLPLGDENLLFYYYHLSDIANGVREEDPHRGYFDIEVHRRRIQNHPWNVRIQENQLSLAYFYSKKADWNIYYNMPEIKVRIEAAIEHILSLQIGAAYEPGSVFENYQKTVRASGIDGTWPKFNYGTVYQPNTVTAQIPTTGIYAYLPGTTFTLTMLAGTIEALNTAKENDPEFEFIDQELYDRMIAAYRKAMLVVLNDKSLWDHGKKATNQYGLIWASVAVYLKYYPDPFIEELMRSKYLETSAFMSPAGYYYENDSLDMGYNTNVHLSNVQSEYHYFKDTPMEELLLEKESKFLDWLSYNIVYDPDGSTSAMNGAASARTNGGPKARLELSISEKIPLARVFARSVEENAEEAKKQKYTLTNGGSWPNVNKLILGKEGTYDPFGILDKTYYQYYPTEEERMESLRMQPYMRSERFNHQRVDDRKRLEISYIRKPNYYAVFNAGQRVNNRQVFGLGILWHPEGGLMLNSQNELNAMVTGEYNYPNARDLSWGTKIISDARSHVNELRVLENGNVYPEYRINGSTVAPLTGAKDLPSGDMSMTYKIGTNGTKSVMFTEEGISVAVYHYGTIAEHLPLLLRAEDKLITEKGKVTLIRGRAVMTITFDPDAEIEITDKGYNVDKYTINMLVIKHPDTLSYKIEMSTQEPELKRAEQEIQVSE